MKLDKFLLGGVAVALVAAYIIAANVYPRDEPATTATPPASSTAAATGAAGQLVRPHSPTLGPADAPVTIVEFLDPECESCAAMHPIMKGVLAEFQGRVRLVVRYMPLHPNSVYAASLLEGARAQNKYWELMDAFFADHQAWASHHAPQPELLPKYAAEVGLDIAQLADAVEDPEIARRIQQDTADGQALGATRTPTIFVNGLPLQRLGYEPLRAAVLAALP
ncbi:MAG: disulfide bond formation protein DsbA [Acidimicrobiia bacterium]|nr:disulfide bond formation protein DsbA [Acidimicrobiia bacterium]